MIPDEKSGVNEPISTSTYDNIGSNNTNEDRCLDKSQLEQQIQNLQLENHKLKEINDNFNFKINVEYQRLAEQTVSREKYYIQEYDKMKSQLKSEIEVLHTDIDKFKSYIDRKDLDMKNKDVQIQRIIQVISRLTSKNFETIEDTCDYLDTNPQFSLNSNIDSVKDEKIKKLDVNTELQREKRRRKTSEKVVLQLQNEILSLKQISKEKEVLEQKCRQLNEKISQFEHNNSIDMIEHQSEISTLSKKIELLNEQNNYLKQKLLSNQTEISHLEIPKPQEITIPEEKMCHRHEELAEVNNDLRREIRSLRNQLSTQKSKIEEQTMEIQQLKSTISDQKGEIISIKTKYNDLSLQASKITTLQDQISKLKLKNSRFKEENAKLKKDLADVTNIVAKLKNNRQETEKPDSSKIIKLQERIHKLEAELDDANNRLEIVQHTDITPNDVLPPNIFHPQNYDKKLTEQIDHIASIECVQPANKIQQIYGVISRYYSEIAGALSDDNYEIKNQLLNLKADIKEFMNTISRELIGFEYPYEYCRIEDTKDLVDRLILLKSDQEKSKKSFYDLKSKIDFVCSIFECNEANFNTKVKEISERIKNYEDIISMQQQKLKKAKKTIKIIHNLNEQENKQICDKINKMNNERINAYQKLANIESKNKMVLSKVETITRQLERKEMENEKLKIQIENQKIDNLDKICSEFKKKEVEIAHLVQDFAKKINFAEDHLVKCECKVARLRKTCETQKETITSLRNELKSLENEQHSDKIKMQNAEQKETKLMLKIQELEEYNESEKKERERLWQENEIYQKEIRNFRSNLKYISNRLKNAEQIVKVKDDEMTRQMILNQEKLKLACSNLENKRNIEILNMKSEFEREKQRIYAFAAANLKQFFDPRDSINFETFCKLILAVSKFTYAQVHGYENASPIES
ncbi:hypothetical protein TVAG_368780 [Trichomonas vaginalis G3]|uniref:Uncharacterized protein n=1 Tax=Trichomonas vaginalis (strain ATCC PRA-98 / G3) TaxID=412133 RepID=A2EUY4_TRIV3|nr:A-type inclusion protein-related family [Trichomonas vaginalis G3]EAY03507.1 hypothetical protein TVAG_368780 [Trichomonas vaginalis G3]KAI5537466.1 A-type inclusion protein-related family [Trichomonas vaginalis G3]|eukprot:XP_001315730.1 hypothetical protein [Trichomonas vaginalis G3]